MIALTCLGLIFGAALGYRQTVFILAPAIVVISAVVAGFGMLAHVGLWSTALAIVVTVTGLQLGYLAGAAWRVVTAHRPDARASTLGKARLG